MWTWERIEHEWLGGGAIAVPTGEAVEAFNLVETTLGSAWMAGCRGSTGSCYGTGPTLGVVNMGQRLAVLDVKAAASERLINKLACRDESASAELTAIYLVKTGRFDVAIELEPEVQVGDRIKMPDFMASVPLSPNVVVEVTQPDRSDDYKDAERILDRLTLMTKDIAHQFTLDVFFRRVPTEEELLAILARLPTFCTLNGIRREDLGELGFLELNIDSPGQLQVRNYEGEENRPRVCMVCAILGDTQPNRHIAVRLAFSDARASRFLTSEAKQLPNDAPGLIMVQVSHALGAFKTWEPILRRRLQPNRHTRVSAICLFQSGLEQTPKGEAWVPRTKIILNNHAKYPLPDWIVQQLSRFTSDW